MKSQGTHAGANRAGGNQENLAPGLALVCNLTNELLQLGKIRLFPAIGQDAGAHLHHHAGDIVQQLGTHSLLGTRPRTPFQITNQIERNRPARTGGMSRSVRIAGAVPFRSRRSPGAAKVGQDDPSAHGPHDWLFGRCECP